MAVMLYLLLRRLGVHPVVAALGVAPVLLDGYQLDIEHQLLSEAFFQLFIVSALVLLAWNRRPNLPAAAATGALIGLASLIRFVGLAAIVAALLYALVRRVGWVRVVTILVAFLVPLAAYGLWFRSVSGSFGITNRNGFYLYGRVVSFADCREVPVPQDLQVFCPRGRPGVGGLFTSGLPRSIRRDPSYNAKAMAFAKRMIRAKPAAYAGAVLSDFLKYFGPGTPQERDSYAGMWRVQEELTARDQRRIPPGITTTFRIDRPLAVFLHGYQGVVWVNGPLLAVLLLMGLIGGAVGWAKRRGRSLAPEAWLFTLAALGLLLFPPVFAVYHFRYVLPVLPLVGCAGALGAAAAAAAVRPEPVAQPASAPEPEAGPAIAEVEGSSA
jgi:hypothetical protein